MKSKIGLSIDQSLFPVFFDWQMAENARFQSMFTLLFLQPHGQQKHNLSDDQRSNINDFLRSQVRTSDLVFHSETENVWLMLLSHSREEEAIVLAERISNSWEEQTKPDETLPSKFAMSILEVLTGSASLEDVYESGMKALQQAQRITSGIPYFIVTKYAVRDMQKIRISILDEDPIVTSVLQHVIEQMAVDIVDFDIRVFHDGFAFLDSDWYLSSSIHVVILNDILPKKNGIEILHVLRSMPNQKKFHIFMMTKRKTEEEMIYVYEHGIDEYITKPFNPRLFEAKLKKLFNRLYE